LIVINIDPVLLYVGGQPLVRWYGLMYVVGILVGLWVAIPYARARGISEDDVWTLFWPAAIGGLLGARLYFVAQSDPLSYLPEPWRIFATWEGGMAFYGAIFGGVTAIGYVCWRKQLDFWRVLDFAAIFAVVGQSFGRIGNLVNGDILGYPTSLPWGFVYVNPNSFAPEKGVAYQPAALYELLFNLVFFAVLWKLRFRFKRSGLLFATWLAGYSLGQFLIFFVRDNVVLFFGLKQAQLTAIVVLLLCIPLVLYLRSRNDDGGQRDQGQRDQGHRQSGDVAEGLGEPHGLG
jgi:phosphatidylglycerol---prolipoprotein diacylglyceryl transferase